MTLYRNVTQGRQNNNLGRDLDSSKNPTYNTILIGFLASQIENCAHAIQSTQFHEPQIRINNKS